MQLQECKAQDRNRPQQGSAHQLDTRSESIDFSYSISYPVPNVALPVSSGWPSTFGKKMTAESEIEFGKTLRAAIKADDVDRVVALLDSRRELLDVVTPFGTWLHVAARAGSIAVSRKLVEMGADIDTSGGTFEAGPLKLAASYGQVEVVRFLLSQGAALDLSEPFRNPLFGAIYNGHLEIVKLLIEHGIDFSMRYTGAVMKEKDALAYAEEQGQTEIAEFLRLLT